MLRITLAEHISNEEVLRKVGTTRKLIFTMIKRQLKFLGHTIRKEGMENLKLTGHSRKMEENSK